MDAVVAITALILALGIVGWLGYEAVQDFVLQPRRDARGRLPQWCSGCDRHDVRTLDMAWTEDNGRYWCRKCRTGSDYG